jgi:hypothetical protein
VLSAPGKDFDPQPDEARELMAYYADDMDNESHWEGNLVAGAFNERSRAERIANVVGFHDGVMGYEGRLGPSTNRAGTAPSVAQLRRDVTEAVENQGGHVLAVRAFSVAGHPVVGVTLQADDAPEFLVSRYPLVDAAAQQNGVAGSYIDVVDDSGAMAQITYGISVGGILMASIGPRSDLQGCGVPHSAPAGYDPPSCPYDGPRPYAIPGTIAERDAVDVVVRSGVREPLTVGAGRGRDLAELCRAAQIDACPQGDADATVWVVGRDDAWAVVNDHSGKVIASG